MRIFEMQGMHGGHCSFSRDPDNQAAEPGRVMADLVAFPHQ
jgi:hypothetical protein